MKPFARIILFSYMALVAGCVSRIEIEHWTLEPCDAATTAAVGGPSCRHRIPIPYSFTTAASPATA